MTDSERATDFWVLYHQHGDDDTFVVGPFHDETEARTAKTAFTCNHPVRILPGLHGPYAIVAVAFEVDMSMVQSMKDHLN